MSAGPADRLLVAVFASPVSTFLLRYGADLGFRTFLVEPDAALVPPGASAVRSFADLADELAGGAADVVVTDHHREELGEQLRDALAEPARWVGIMGNPRQEGPHVAAAAIELSADDLARLEAIAPPGVAAGGRYRNSTPGYGESPEKVA